MSHKFKKKSSGKRKREMVGIFGVRSFGRYGDFHSSDSSDSDYKPDFELENEKKPNKKRREDNSRRSRSRKHFAQSQSAAIVAGQQSQLATNINIRREAEHGIQSTEIGSVDCRVMKSRGKDVNWNNLPLEILVKIFTFVLGENSEIASLIRFRKVCKQWRNASQHPLLWRKLDLSFMSKSGKANDKMLQNLASQCGEHILELNVSNWKKLTDKGLIVIARLCQNLKVLNISGCTDNKKKENSITANSVIEIIDKCNITSIDMSWLQMIPKSSIVIQTLMERRGKHLLNLNLCGCPIRSTALNNIMASCSNLQTLDISKTEIRNINVKKLQMSFPNLEELYMSNAGLEFTNYLSKDEGKDPCFEKLVALSVVSSNLSDRILHRLLKGASKLKLLDIRCCPRLAITTQTLTEIEAVGVERLFLSFASSSFLLREIIGKWGNTLIELDLSWLASGSTSSHCLSNEELKDIAQTGFQMSNLEKLNLSGTKVEDEGVRHLISICPKLASLNLTSCKGISRGYKHEHDKDSIDKMRTGNDVKFVDLKRKR